MLLSESEYARQEAERKSYHEKAVKEGMNDWKKHQEVEKLRKLQEQKEAREMLQNYWPWGQSRAKPRGLRNLRLEELFPDKDYIKAKRASFGGGGGGGGGGGAPLVTAGGKKLTKTRLDPILRFQFGKDVRRTVDNTLRYKTNKEQQNEYRKELDKLVEEKKQKLEKEKREEAEYIRKQFQCASPWGKKGPGGNPWRHPYTIRLNFLKSMGWSDKDTLKQMQQEASHYQKEYDKFKRMRVTKPNQLSKLEPMKLPGKNIFTSVRDRKLSPLPRGKEEGAELVSLIAEKRNNQMRVPLVTTDVTRCDKNYTQSIWRRTGSAYLRELNQQIKEKENILKKIRDLDKQTVQTHFSTWESFWGRPGHGAPRSTIRLQRMDPMIIPHVTPLAVH